MIYVVIQFSCIIYLMFNAQYEYFGFIEIALVLLALLIGLIAVFNMKFNNLNITPWPKTKSPT